jgi:hypothetical protein
MMRWIVPGIAAAAVVAASCTGDDPSFGPPDALTDAGNESGGGDASDATDLLDRATDTAPPKGTHRACENAPRLPRVAGDRVLFEPFGILVNEAGAFVGWEETITKKQALAETAATGATTVRGCCLSVDVGGALVYPHGTELDVGAGSFSLFAQIKRRGPVPPQATGGSAIWKKPGPAPSFTGLALFLARRDVAVGIEDKPRFQLQYDPTIALDQTPPVPRDVFLVVAGTRRPADVALRVGNSTATRNPPDPVDAISLDNTGPLYLAGGGDNHFTGELCAVVLNVGDEANFDTRASAVQDLTH